MHTQGHVPLGLGEVALRSPEAVALAAPHCRSLTFRGLVDQIESAGEALRNAGAYAGSATALALTQGPAAVTAALAIMTGSACAPVELNLTEKEYKDYFGQLRPAALVWDGVSNPVAAQAARQLGIGVIGLRVPRDGPAGAFEIVEVSAAARDLDIRQTDQAMIFQTSATTGVPKLVPRSHAALEILASENAGVLELSAADRYLNLISLTHAAGPDAIFAQLVSGGSVFCTPGFREDGFVEWLDVFRPTWFLATPTIHRAILLAVQQVKPEFLAQVPLRFVRTGGAPADSELIQLLERRFGVPVLEGYGLAEVPTVSRNRLSWRKPGSVGMSTGPEISIQDESGTSLPADAEGEVVLRGPTVMAAYLDNPEANQEAFHEGWFRTGDIGRIDADGFLFLAGRRKELINRGAKKIFPQEVDDALIRHPAVADAATFAIPHRSLGEDVAACAILREGQRVSERELREFTSQRLAPFKVPRRIFFVPSIPKTASGKPKRLELTRRFGEELAAARRVVDAGPERPANLQRRKPSCWRFGPSCWESSRRGSMTTSLIWAVIPSRPPVCCGAFSIPLGEVTSSLCRRSFSTGPPWPRSLRFFPPVPKLRRVRSFPTPRSYFEAGAAGLHSSFSATHSRKPTSCATCPGGWVQINHSLHFVRPSRCAEIACSRWRIWPRNPAHPSGHFARPDPTSWAPIVAPRPWPTRRRFNLLRRANRSLF